MGLNVVPQICFIDNCATIVCIEWTGYSRLAWSSIFSVVGFECIIIGILTLGVSGLWALITDEGDRFSPRAHETV